MKPTKILSDEHRVIEQVLDCLEKMIERINSEGSLEKQPALDAVAFFRAFADRCHHGKEEAHLFPAMEAKGYSPRCGPTAVMRREHELGRAHVRAMAQSIEAAAGGHADALDTFAERAQAYVALLREHIQKEDHCLFPMADQALSEDDQRQLLAVFRKVESEEIGEGTHDEYVKIANELADRFDVPRAVTTSEGQVGCCGH